MVDVEVNYEELFAVMKTDKTKTNYRLEKDRSGHRFFEFKVDKGPLPEELQGKFSSLDKGVEAFKQFDRNKKKTQTVRRDEWNEERDKRSAKLRSESS